MADGGGIVSSLSRNYQILHHLITCIISLFFTDDEKRIGTRGVHYAHFCILRTQGPKRYCT